ncbi:MAG: hypothetical protein COU69_01110 [Candidatus Pacebacteria bacterium CG10_big_fil_rev_8_21_14_0_10_56_10]|nr:MAG: hypothetical protein COU69_01110 [Candidatus Pacebacteria bacterium CG10_big_fil_rev_8_21_14_0_10_56_10]
MQWTRSAHTVSISPSIVVTTLASLIGLYLLFQIRFIILLVFLAFIIMTALHPAVSGLHRRLKLPRVVAILAVYAVVIGSIAVLLSLIIPPLVNQLGKLVNTFDIPGLTDQVRQLKFNLSDVTVIFEQLSSRFGFVYSLIASTFSGLITVFTLIVLSVYIMLDRPHLHKKISWFTRDKKAIKLAEQFVDDLEYQLGGWVRGQLVLMFSIGLVTYLGLTLLSMPFALPLAILAGLLEILPNIGPTIAALPAVIFAFITGGPVLAGAVVVLYLIVQQFENSLLVPKVMHDNVDVNPLVSIVTILIGLQLGGVLGAVISIPVYIVARQLYSVWYRQHHS